MKKNRMSAINSYASYKEIKAKWLMTGVVLIIGAVILLIALLSGRFHSDINAFFLENHLQSGNLSNLPHSDDVIVTEGKICYDLYSVPKETKGIYIPSKKADNIKQYIKLAKETEVNSFVLDVKDDNGYLTFDTDNKHLVSAGVVRKHPPIEDIDKVMNCINEAGIYPIARIVVFKDNVYTAGHPDSAMKCLNGSTYVTSGGDKWLDPYNEENWEYILEVCREAYRHGFKEIQFDYVRFHESMNAKTAILHGGQSKTEIITEFIKYMCDHLHDMGMKVSADVFGAVILSDLDASIVGQDFIEMSKSLDYISPMVYPSHYAQGTFGVDYPHMKPYIIVLKSLKLGQDKMDKAGGDMAKMRPWLQDFTLSAKEPYLKYGPDQIKEQIQGACDAGTNNWLFWNAAGNYTKEGLMAP